MMTLTKSAVGLLTVGLLMLWSVPVGGEPASARTDSLVWYVEQLEYDLAICEIGGMARSDSLKFRLDYTQRQLEWANQDRRKWYQSPSLWFILGAGAGIAVTGLMVRVNFD